MTPRFEPSLRRPADELPPEESALLLARARMLQRAALAGTPAPPLLRGKQLGLLCESDTTEAAELFRRAAAELGAHVAHVRPLLSERSTPQELQPTARLLGRLYHAIECQGLPDALVRRLGDECGVPVYAGLASPAHATAVITGLLGDIASPAQNRRFVVQAVLLYTIG